MIAFTNHALDHLLCSVLDADITQKIVRLGSRSSNERIAKFSIEAMEEVAGRSRLDRAFNHHRDLKRVEEELKKVMQECVSADVDSTAIMRHLEIAYPLPFQTFLQLPPWIDLLHQAEVADSGWTQVGRGGQRTDADDKTSYGYWVAARDLTFLDAAQHQLWQETEARQQNDQEKGTVPHAPNNRFEALGNDDDSDASDGVYETASVGDSDVDSDSDFEEVHAEEAWLRISNKSDSPQAAEVVLDPTPLIANPPQGPPNADVEASEPGVIRPIDLSNIQDFFGYFGYARVPTAPATNRTLGVLLDLENVWDMSRTERRRVHEFWTREVRTAAQDSNQQEFERLRTRHAEALKRFNEGKAEVGDRCAVNFDVN